MFHRPLSIEDSKRDRFERVLETCEAETDAAVDRTLAAVPLESLREQVAATVFSPSDALPKRNRRPKREITMLLDGLETTVGGIGDNRKPLLSFGLIVNEYYDICDDVVDQDVVSDSRAEVILTWQVMVPLLARLVHRLGTPAVEFWSDRAMGLIEAPFVALRAEPSRDTYKKVLDRQADLFGCLTGLCGLLGECDEETIIACEDIGRAFFKFEQLLLDGEQFADGETAGWNAFVLLDSDRVISRIATIRSEYRATLAELPGEPAQKLEWLVAVDLNRWQREVFDTDG